jgi:hypothetical protein
MTKDCLHTMPQRPFAGARDPMFVQETRMSRQAAGALTGLGLLILLPMLLPALTHPMPPEERLRLLSIAGVTTLLYAGLVMIFSTVRVVIDEQTLTVGFGPFRERVPLSRVTACSPTTYRWWDWGGWGIRLGWRAKLYNVPGDRGVAVEVTLDDGRRLLFSSTDPAAVCQAIREWYL